MQKPKTTFPNFQSFLVFGFDDEEREKELSQIVQKFGLSLQETSPDLFFIESQTPYISIESIRNLKKHIYQKPLKENFKLIVIKQAEKLTLEAQNALLKILEEPPKSAIIIMETKNKEKLAKTILSRVATISTLQKNPKPVPARRDLNFETISEIQNPISYLEEQIIENHTDLVKALSQKDNKMVENLSRQIETLAEAKKMIEANVNSKFVLANLIFNKL